MYKRFGDHFVSLLLFILQSFNVLAGVPFLLGRKLPLLPPKFFTRRHIFDSFAQAQLFRISWHEVLERVIRHIVDVQAAILNQLVVADG